MSHILNTSRPQPVRLMAVVLAVLAFLTGAAGLGDLIPKVAMGWLIVVYGAVQVAWGAWTASQVTPLAAPQTSDGRALVPLSTPGAAAGPGEAGDVDVIRLLGIVVAVILVVWLLTWLL